MCVRPSSIYAAGKKRTDTEGEDADGATTLGRWYVVMLLLLLPADDDHVARRSESSRVHVPGSGPSGASPKTICYTSTGRIYPGGASPEEKRGLKSLHTARIVEVAKGSAAAAAAAWCSI